MSKARFEMALDKDVDVRMRDGALLRANVFRPKTEGRFPVLMTFGPYGKDVHISEFMPEAWELLKRRYPEILKATSGKYLVFETPDPEMWVPDGFVLVKVDSRGAGKSPGKLDVNAPGEFRDFYDAIEWAAVQPWANGKVGLLGISYYAAGQWMVATLKPPHLKAILPWQGGADFYRDRTHQGGMLGTGFLRRWWPRSVLRNQHGNPESPFHDIDTGERNTGPSSLSPAALAQNRVDYVKNLVDHPLDGAFYRERSGDLAEIDLPALVVANWGGLALHLRGTIGGYLGLGSREKWLKVQAGSYFLTFLQPKNVEMMQRFFRRYLLDEANGWEHEPRVEVEVRAPDDTVRRAVTGTAWPLPDIRWTRLHLDAAAKSLAPTPPGNAASVSYAALSEGVTFWTEPFAAETELAGPVKLRLHVSSTTDDMDIFATLRAFDAEGKEATFISATEPRSPVSQGWLRVSHRKLDPTRSAEWQPFLAHDEIRKLTPGEIYAVDLEIWPMSLAIPAGHRLALTLQGKDFERPGDPGPTRGSSWFLHEDPIDRPPQSFAGTNTLHTGWAHESYLLLPVLPG